jgi:hypothetical protein
VAVQQECRAAGQMMSTCGRPTDPRLGHQGNRAEQSRNKEKQQATPGRLAGQIFRCARGIPMVDGALPCRRVYGFLDEAWLAGFST